MRRARQNASNRQEVVRQMKWINTYILGLFLHYAPPLTYRPVQAGAAGLFLGGKDVNEFVDKAVTEALKKEGEKEEKRR